MKAHARLMVFSVAAGLAYTLAYYFDVSLFQYYLGEARFHVSPQPESAGPPILWYGWLGAAVLAGTVIALAIPQRLAARIPADLVWLIPAALILAAMMYELRWFV